jgi:hypothetical protein
MSGPAAGCGQSDRLPGRLVVKIRDAGHVRNRAIYVEQRSARAVDERAGGRKVWWWANYFKLTHYPQSGTAPAVATTAVTLSTGTTAVTSRAYVSGQNGLIDTETDPSGHITKYGYVAVRSAPGINCPVSRSNLYASSVTRAYGTAEAQVRQFYYDCATGQLKDEVFETNSNVRTHYEHDVYGRVTSEVRGAYLARQNADDATAAISSTASSAGIRTITIERTVANDAHYTLTSNPHLPGVTDAEQSMGWTVRKLDRAGRPQAVYHYRGAARPTQANFGTN